MSIADTAKQRLEEGINLTPKRKPGGHHVIHNRTYWIDQIVGSREVDSPDDYDRLCYGGCDMESFIDTLVD